VANAVTVYNRTYNKYKNKLNKPQQSTDNNETRCDAAASAQTAQVWRQFCAFIGNRQHLRISCGKNGLWESGDRQREKLALKLQTAGTELCISYKQKLVYRLIDSVVVLRYFGEHREWRDMCKRQAVCICVQATAGNCSVMYHKSCQPICLCDNTSCCPYLALKWEF
jgi:hypothetical protein